MFAGTNTEGQQDLFTVLKNFSILKPEIAYCQGLSKFSRNGKMNF